MPWPNICGTSWLKKWAASLSENLSSNIPLPFIFAAFFAASIAAWSPAADTPKLALAKVAFCGTRLGGSFPTPKLLGLSIYAPAICDTSGVPNLISEPYSGFDAISASLPAEIALFKAFFAIGLM
jgi:hypothetical protein